MADNKANTALKDVKIQLIIKQEQPVGTTRYMPVDVTELVREAVGQTYRLGYYLRYFADDVQGLLIEGENTGDCAKFFTSNDLDEIREQITQLIDVAIVNGAQNKAFKQQVANCFRAMAASKNPANASTRL